MGQGNGRLHTRVCGMLPWHLTERGSDPWPRVTTCDSHCQKARWLVLAGHVSVRWRANPPGAITHKALANNPVCICVSHLAVLNCLVDGLGNTGQQKLTDTHQTKQPLVSTLCPKTLKKAPKQSCYKQLTSLHHTGRRTEKKKKSISQFYFETLHTAYKPTDLVKSK